MNDDKKKMIDIALGETMSSDHFNTSSIEELAATLSDNDILQEQEDQAIEQILLDTLADTVDDLDGDEVHAAISDATFSYQLDAENSMNIGVPGRYTISKILGKGATGQVFSIHDNNFNRSVAVKFLHPSLAGDISKVKQFIKEARITARLNHPNILPIHDFDLTEGALIYFTMGKVDGQSLQELIAIAKETGVVPEHIRSYNNRIRIIQQICHAIAYAHSQGIMHKDIKPSNILIGHYGEVLLVDWGTASRQGDPDEATHMSGTPLYMSPEQARKEPSDFHSDIYCIGSTFFHLLTLRYPCWHDNLDTFWEMKRNGTYQKPNSEELKNIPVQLLTIAEKAMSVNKLDRYSHAGEIIADLDAFQQGRSVSAYRENIWQVLVRLYRHNKKIASLAALCLLIIIYAATQLYFEKFQSSGSWTTITHHTWDTGTIEKFDLEWDFAPLSILQKQDDLNPLNLPMDNNSTVSKYKHIIGFQNDTISFKPLTQASLFNLRYRQRINGNMRISWDHTLPSDTASIEFFIGGRRSDRAYTFHLSEGTLKLKKYDRIIARQTLPLQIQGSRSYALRMTKSESTLTLSINQHPVLFYSDPEILTGVQHQQFGFVHTQDSDYAISNLHIERSRLPSKQEPISIADDYYSNQLYENAFIHYESIRKNYPNTYMSALALYRMGLCHSKLGKHQQASIKFQNFIQDYREHEVYPFAAFHLILSLAQSKKWNACLTTLQQNRHRLQESLAEQLVQELQQLIRSQSKRNQDMTDLLHILDQIQATSEPSA